jgi:tyrosine-specific transport protein
MNKKLLVTTFTLTGSIIGAGILGLPYVFAKSGFLVGIFWLLLFGAILIFSNLALGEVTLRTKGIHQLSGYANKYLGKWGKNIMFAAMIFGIYSALLAYLIGEGESFSRIIPGNFPPIIFGIMFWLVMTLLLKDGMKGLKKIELWGVIGIIGIVIGMFVKFLPSVKPENLMVWNSTNFTVPIGVVMFALLGFTSIPELRREIKGKEGLLKKAIIIGTLIPVALYILFSIIFIGVLGKEVNQVATLSLGPFATILGIFTMLTSYFVLSFSLKNTFKYDMKASSRKTFIFASVVPLLLYLLVTKFNIMGFTLVLGLGGVISGGITGILVLLMAKKAKSNTRNGKDPEIKVPINWFLIIILSLVFIAGIVLQILG